MREKIEALKKDCERFAVNNQGRSEGTDDSEMKWYYRGKADAYENLARWIIDILNLKGRK